MSTLQEHRRCIFTHQTECVAINSGTKTPRSLALSTNPRSPISASLPLSCRSPNGDVYNGMSEMFILVDEVGKSGIVAMRFSQGHIVARKEFNHDEKGELRRKKHVESVEQDK